VTDGVFETRPEYPCVRLAVVARSLRIGAEVSHFFVRREITWHSTVNFQVPEAVEARRSDRPHFWSRRLGCPDPVGLRLLIWPNGPAHSSPGLSASDAPGSTPIKERGLKGRQRCRHLIYRGASEVRSGVPSGHIMFCCVVPRASLALSPGLECAGPLDQILGLLMLPSSCSRSCWCWSLTRPMDSRSVRFHAKRRAQIVLRSSGKCGRFVSLLQTPG
jgi:hypothetical protein